MGVGAVSAPDPYKLGVFTFAGSPVLLYNEYGTRTQVSPVLVGGETTKCIITLGDSMLANSIDSVYTVTQAKNQNMNISNGGVYTSVDPLMGPSNGFSAPNVGTAVSELIDQIIIQAYAARVIAGPISIGSTVVAEWAAGGVLNQNIGVICRRFSSVGLTVNGVIWHAGPNDVVAGTNQADYTTRLNSVISTIRTYLPTVPVLVGLCSDRTSPNSAIRAAQASVVNHGLQIWEGVDSDAYASGNFQVGAHFNATGRAAVALDYVTKLHAAGAI